MRGENPAENAARSWPRFAGDSTRPLAAGHKTGLSPATRWLLFFAAMFAVSGGIVTLTDMGARNVALAWAAQFSQRLGRDVPPQSAAGFSPDQTQATWPKPIGPKSPGNPVPETLCLKR